MNGIDPLRAGVQQYLRELSDDDWRELVQTVRPPGASTTTDTLPDELEPVTSGAAGIAEAQRRFGKQARSANE